MNVSYLLTSVNQFTLNSSINFQQINYTSNLVYLDPESESLTRWLEECMQKLRSKGAFLFIVISHNTSIFFYQIRFSYTFMRLHMPTLWTLTVNCIFCYKLNNMAHSQSLPDLEWILISYTHWTLCMWNVYHKCMAQHIYISIRDLSIHGEITYS